MTTVDNEGTTIQCLLNAINENQETIRGYDTKAEILGVLMALVVGFLNFNLISDYKGDYLVMLLIATTITIAVVALVCMLFVLFPSCNPVEYVNLGGYVPKGTYFIFKKRSDKFDFSSIYAKMVDTDWQKELLLELLKVSGIRDRKHFWFSWSVKIAVLALVCVVLLVIRIGCVCTIK